MASFRRITISVIVLAMLSLIASTVWAQKVPKSAPPKNNPSKETIVTGTHRGYNNDQFFVRLDNGTEMTFLVRIPGDTDQKWHNEFKLNSKVTVTYHQETGEKLPVATAIKKANDATTTQP
jgi:hypothetical protein